METTPNFTIDTRPRTYSSVSSIRELRSRARVYVPHDFAMEAEPTGPVCTDLECGSAACSAARNSGHPERCEVDHKVWRAWLRRGTKQVREAVLPKLSEVTGVPVTGLKMHFSSTAGCSCGCSPGFIVDGCPGGVDFFVRQG